MGYSGETLNQCGILNIDCSRVEVVAVTGDGPNVCGHLILHTRGTDGGKYFHVSDLRGYPKYMTEAGYRKYLATNGKSEIRRVPIALPKPHAAFLYLERLMSEKWTWMVLPNNCVAFVEEVIRAGGAKWKSLSNCPDIATQSTINERIQLFLIELDRQIYQLYGVPRL